MNSHSFPSRSERSLFECLLATVTASLRRSPSTEHVTALAASLAAELRTEPGVADVVLELSSLPRADRNAALLRAAQFFRGDWRTFGIADSLRRLTRPDLFQAVIRELQTQVPSSSAPYFTIDALIEEVVA